ncbi:hypothetical protein HS5_04430 [Acidianus sp. HS-5]|nr:hypothetical protein HS5_04430 [Acidianus sp. HS-5]
MAKRYSKTPSSEPVFRATKGNGAKRRTVMTIKSTVSFWCISPFADQYTTVRGNKRRNGTQNLG